MYSAIVFGFLLATPAVHAQQTPQAIDQRYSWDGGGEYIEVENFFDFARAKSLWIALKTPDQFKAFKAKNCPYPGAYSKWRRRFEADQKAAIAELKGLPDAEQIRLCHDLFLAAYRWEFVTNPHRKEPAKLDENSKACESAKNRNYFTGTCNGLPNWYGWRNN